MPFIFPGRTHRILDEGKSPPLNNLLFKALWEEARTGVIPQSFVHAAFFIAVYRTASLANIFPTPLADPDSVKGRGLRKCHWQREEFSR